MTTKKERDAMFPTEPTPSGRKSRAKPAETTVAEPVPADENPPEAPTETVAVHTSPHTCVFCQGVVEVDLDNMGGGRFISEPALSIKSYVCEGCNDA